MDTSSRSRPSSARRSLRSAAAGSAILLTAFLLGACDSSVVGTDGPAENQVLARVRLEFDLTKGTAEAVILPGPGSQRSASLPLDSGPRLAIVNGLLSAGPANCLGCNNGVLGVHEVSVTLTNASTAFRINNIGYNAQLAGCTFVAGNTVPSVNTLAPGEQITVYYAVDVTQPKFSVMFDVDGTVAAFPP